MNNFKFFNVNRIYNELFYQFPKVLIASDKYKKMSDSTKIAYMLLKARLEFAVQRNQVDENGNVYFTFTISELGEVLDCGKQKVLAIKSQLEEYGLLYQKQMGFNKTLGKNNPNRLYLAELEVTENDIYQLQTFDDTMQENVDKSEGMKIIPTPQGKTNAECLGNQEGMKIIPCQNVDKSEGMKISTVFN
ncbi:replication initiator protein A, partial [Enterococcus faecalis]